MHIFYFGALITMSLTSCQQKAGDVEEFESDTAQQDTAIENEPAVPTGSIPVFVVAGQSNAEGNVRIAGLEALQAALPAHRDSLSVEERTALREAYRIGIGDWCNPDEDYAEDLADASIDTFRALGLDISSVSPTYQMADAEMVSYRWFHQEASEELGAPYENPDPNAHPAHKNLLSPMGVGFGLWDSEETDVLFYGPELGFALRLKQEAALDEFYMMKVAMGGSSLYEHWAPNGPMHQKLYEKTDAFLANNDAYVAGLIWFQGYNDQFEAHFRAAYKQNLHTLLFDFRQSYGADLPVVVVQSRKVHDLRLIAEAQAEVVSELSNTALVESDGLTNCFHYDSISQLIIGDRTATAMISLLQ